MGDDEYISIRCIQKDDYSTVARDEVVLFAATLNWPIVIVVVM